MCTSAWQLVVTASVGSSYLGDIAVDDFKLNPYPCKLGTASFLYTTFLQQQKKD